MVSFVLGDYCEMLLGTTGWVWLGIIRSVCGGFVSGEMDRDDA